MTRPAPVKVVAFDVFDTLARWPDSRVLPIDVQRLLGRFGIDISYQAFEAARQAVFFFECPKRQLTGWTDFFALVFHAMGIPLSTDLLACVANEYQSRNNMVLFDDAVPALDAVRAAGLTACAFTTLPRFMLGDAAAQILPRLDHYFDAAAIGLPKGDRRFYERITEKLAVAPAEILAVGDDPLCDIALPLECGWRAFLLNRSEKAVPAHHFNSPVISTLNQLSSQYLQDYRPQ